MLDRTLEASELVGKYETMLYEGEDMLQQVREEASLSDLLDELPSYVDEEALKN